MVKKSFPTQKFAHEILAYYLKEIFWAVFSFDVIRNFLNFSNFYQVVGSTVPWCPAVTLALEQNIDWSQPFTYEINDVAKYMYPIVDAASDHWKVINLCRITELLSDFWKWKIDLHERKLQQLRLTNHKKSKTKLGATNFSKLEPKTYNWCLALVTFYRC